MQKKWKMGVFFVKKWKMGVFFVKRWKMGGLFFVKKWTFPQRRCIMYSISIFYFTFYLFERGAYAPNARFCLRA